MNTLRSTVRRALVWLAPVALARALARVADRLGPRVRASRRAGDGAVRRSR